MTPEGMARSSPLRICKFLQQNRSKYQYIKVGNGIYLQSQQNFLVFLYWLYHRGKSFRLRPTTAIELLKSLRTPLSWIGRLILSRLSITQGQPVLDLPFYGHICLEVHRGYKIFNLKQCTVTKVFKPEVDPNMIIQEIDRCRYAAQYDFSPAILAWDLQDRWYTEEFVNGYPVTSYTHGYPVSSSNPKDFLSTYYRYIAKNIEKMAVCDKPQMVNTSDYIGKILELFLTKTAGESKNSQAKEIDQIWRFINQTAEKLQKRGECDLYIVLSHGDFGNNHVLDIGFRTVMIDWEYMSYRSVLFDFYSCFLEQLFFKRNVPDIVNQIYEALLYLQNSLYKRDSHIADSLVDLHGIYRFVFYIERICTDVDYGLFVKTKLRWIDTFKAYERMQTVQGLRNLERCCSR